MTYKDIICTLLILSLIFTIGLIFFIKTLEQNMVESCMYVPLDEIKNTKCLEVL